MINLKHRRWQHRREGVVLFLIGSFAALLTSCALLDSDTENSPTPDPDQDGDGLVGVNDCDDTDPDINAAEDEVPYNGRDNDCNPETPDDDLDADGYLQDDDCDDQEATTYPFADEHCDGVDNDCDGTTDEREAVDAVTWYKDADGDSYGNAHSLALGCEQPEGYVADSSDCDDDNAAVHPGATEMEGDGLDNDCDESTDDGPDVHAPTLWWVDFDPDITNGGETPYGYSESNVEVGAYDNEDVVEIRFQQTCCGCGSVYAEPWIYEFFFCIPSEGTKYTLTATAYDAAGNSASISMVVYEDG